MSEIQRQLETVTEAAQGVLDELADLRALVDAVGEVVDLDALGEKAIGARGYKAAWEGANPVDAYGDALRSMEKEAAGNEADKDATVRRMRCEHCPHEPDCPFIGEPEGYPCRRLGSGYL